MDSMTALDIDKLAHLIMYGLFSWLGCKAFEEFIFKIGVIGVILGISLEIIQGYCTTYRMFDFYDILFNIIGSVIGIWLFVYSKKK